MAGAAAQSRLSDQHLVRGGAVFHLAGPEDDHDLRRLLRENSLGGRIQITLEREPSAVGGAIGDPSSHAFVIARDRRTGEAIGMCERVVRRAFVDGEALALPYIGALRVAASHRHRIGILRGGFEALRRLAASPGELPFALTAITSDNAAARRLLTRGLPGLPVYRPAGQFSTFVVRARRAKADLRARTATDDELPAIAEFLNATNRGHQLAPEWTAGGLRSLTRRGLEARHFLVWRDHGAIRGCIAVWDQRACRQIVVRRYPQPMGLLRPLLNLVAPLADLAPLPAPGLAAAQTILAHLAVADDDAEIFLALVAAALDQARARGLEIGVVGLPTAHPWRDRLLRRHRAIEYETSLYLAHWPDGARRVAAIGPGLPRPDLGLL